MDLLLSSRLQVPYGNDQMRSSHTTVVNRFIHDNSKSQKLFETAGPSHDWINLNKKIEQGYISNTIKVYDGLDNQHQNKNKSAKRLRQKLLLKGSAKRSSVETMLPGERETSLRIDEEEYLKTEER